MVTNKLKPKNPGKYPENDVKKIALQIKEFPPKPPTLTPLYLQQTLSPETG